MKLSKIIYAISCPATLFALTYCVPNPVYHSDQQNKKTIARESSNQTSEAITGIASFYADKFHGRKTASGDIFDQKQFTAAHRTYPFGAIIKVTHLGNGRSVQVRINDRGPFVKGRIIDLSLAAAKALDMVKAGKAEVELTIIQWGK